MVLSNAKIVVVDSNRLFRAGLVSLLTRQTASSIAEASSISDLASLVTAEDAFDLVLLEVCDGQEEDPCPVSEVRDLLPQARVTMLADRLDPTRLRKCFAAGADGFLLKNISSETLLGSLTLIRLGEKIFPSPLADLLSSDGQGMLAPVENGGAAPAPGLQINLSDREIEILRCLITGDSNKRIANRLNIAEATVKVHLKSILRKTRAMNRTQAAIWALQRGVSGIAAGTLVALTAEGWPGFADIALTSMEVAQTFPIM